MTDTEARRLALYNRLQEVLGTGPATTLMSHLPPIEAADLVTKSAFNDFKTEMRDFKTEMREFKTEVALRFERVDARFDDVNKRIDRVLLAVVVGQFALLAAIIGAAALF